jgi:cytidyltransferase-like protein
MSTVLFSGRFDPPHLGHMITVARLWETFDAITIVILDYPESEYPISYRAQALKEMVRHLNGRYKVLVNQTHFGKITREELSKFKFDVYASGNLEVLKHIESLGFKTLYVERSYEYSGTEIRMKNSAK